MPCCGRLRTTLSSGRSDMTCKECGATSCHRNQVNPYCSATVRTRCDYCGRVRTVKGLHFCEESE